VPALDLHPVTGTTVGLGDSFVGGFVVGLAQSGARPGAPAQAQAQAKVQVQVQVRASAPWRSKP
jgi:sugar/nucleoside kinase (ribokinase family)